MLPGLRDGDRVLVRYATVPRVGDVVVARLRDGTLVIKRAAGRRTTSGGSPGWWLLSDNAAEGVGDSRAHGPVADRDVLAVVTGRLWPRPRRLRGRAPRPSRV